MFLGPKSAVLNTHTLGNVAAGLVVDRVGGGLAEVSPNLAVLVGFRFPPRTSWFDETSGKATSHVLQIKEELNLRRRPLVDC